jgi:hypothetical protein
VGGCLPPHRRGAATAAGCVFGPRPISVEIARGELIDKITILEIKSERITDAARRHHVGTELALLVAARDCTVPGSAELARLATELKEANEALWHIEDEIRPCERDEDFGPRFIAQARSVYRTNDRRAALKRQINERLGCQLIEEKSYTSELIAPVAEVLRWVRDLKRMPS